MTNEACSPMDMLSRSELASFVARALGKPDVEVLEWQQRKFAGGAAEAAGGGLGVYRLSGSARDTSDTYPWSLVFKIQSGANPSGGAAPADWNYWKREVLAYQSGLLDHLPGGHPVAARCYGVTERANQECWICLEDIHEAQPVWAFELHGLAAQHLGQFNGAYLAGHPLPAEQPWFLPGRGRTRFWLEEAASNLPNLREFAATKYGRPWITERSIERLIKLWANRKVLLEAIHRLPICLCHHDGFRRNLFTRDMPSGGAQTVAIDWSHVGYGGVGQEAGTSTAVNLMFLEIPGDRARALDTMIFESYLDGLRDSGWHGDAHQARLGYTAGASLDFGICWTVSAIVWFVDEHIAAVEHITGHKISEVMEQYAQTLHFLLDLGDEALALLEDSHAAP